MSSARQHDVPNQSKARNRTPGQTKTGNRHSDDPASKTHCVNEEEGAHTSPPRPLSREDRELIFRDATRGLVHHHGHRFAGGMNDTELHEALEQSLGIFGGSGGPGRPSVTYKGAGLKIWGGWQVVNHVTTTPLFSGEATLAMARETYGIANPDAEQLNLL